jgi:hypothetical protein
MCGPNVDHVPICGSIVDHKSFWCKKYTMELYMMQVLGAISIIAPTWGLVGLP